jgi:long-chain acyl-CoA synthetase
MVVATEGLSPLALSAAIVLGDKAQGLHVLHYGRSSDPEDFEALIEKAVLPPLPSPVVGREMIYSSGTTGKPKGIWRELSRTATNPTLPPLEKKLREIFRFDDTTRYLSLAPLYHATGRFLNRTIECGGTVIIAPTFDAQNALAAIERFDITHSQWVPTMFAKLLALPDEVRDRYDLSSHRVAMHAAAPCPPAVKRSMIQWWGPILEEYYGGTENAGVTYVSSPDWLDHPGSVGRSITGRIHVVDENDPHTELSPGQIGLIYFEGGVPFRYTDQPVQPEDGRTAPEGWSTYGDLGHIDADGYLYISDRRNDLIISGGVNVYPKEVEIVIEQHSSVREVAVIGVPDQMYGQQVMAVVCAELDADADALREELLSWCRSRLSPVKCPRRIAFIDELPRNETGKLLKNALRRQYSDAVR